MHYIEAIKSAFLWFPLIAFLFTIPFILHQYHKYGSIHKLRVLIIYSFILYLLCTYFLVVLPLSPMEGNMPLKKDMVQLVPFGFVFDIIKETSFRIDNPNTYLKSLLDPCMYTVFFNIIMTIPFGIYLRYYFKCNKKKTIFYTFCLSLFFELTQLTRLYFIFPYPYRVFDVDDLMINTLGGYIGYSFVPLFSKILPTREEIDEKAYKVGEKVSGLRRVTLFCFDFVFCTFLSFFTFLFHMKISTFFLTFLFYYVGIPLLMKGQTIGGKFLNVKLEYKKYKVLWNFIRISFLYLYYFLIPFLIIKSNAFLINSLQMETRKSIYIYLLAFISILLFYFLHLFFLIKNHILYYDKLGKGKYISTIKDKKESPL